MKFRVKKKLLKQLEKIEDFRRRRDQMVYPLHEILFVSLLGLIKGYVTFDELHFYFAKNKDNKIFKKLFNKKKLRVPVRSTLHRILSNVSHDKLEIIFREYFSKFAIGNNIAIEEKRKADLMSG